MAPGTLLRVLTTSPGLTRQRMVGVEALSADTEVVHFLDDDVVLEEGYFEAIEDCFAADQLVLGVSPLAQSADRPPANWRGRFFLRDSNVGGRVLASGINVLPRPVLGVSEVQWLSGCGMSFRTSVFKFCRFDESLEGYCLGEDVDFSLELPVGRLLVARVLA